MVCAAAPLFAVNGTVSKGILESGLSSLRLAEVRSLGALAGLAVVVALFARGTLRVDRRELPFLLVFGIAGLALVQWFYFLAIHRLEIGIALVIQYLAPVLVALWARFVVGEAVRRRLWLAIALALVGLGLVVQLWQGLTLDAAGVAACLAGAVAYAAYVLMAERGLREGRDSISLLAWGFLFSALVWAVAQPWWSFPFGELASGRDALLAAGVVVVGTLLPFLAMVAALALIPAPRAGVVPRLEPVPAALFPWLLLGEALAAVQVFGMALVVAAVVWVQLHRPDLEAEAAPVRAADSAARPTTSG